jgi:hypothetical protein
MIKSGFKYLTETKQSLQMQITALETELQKIFCSCNLIPKMATRMAMAIKSQPNLRKPFAYMNSSIPQNL